MKTNSEKDKPACIFLVDDSSTNNLLFKSIFEETGYEVMVEEDPVTALGRIRECVPDLVLLDMMLPGTNGLQLLQQIKSEVSSEIPVMMYTAHKSDRLEKQAMALGAAKYLVKPLSPIEILEEVSKVLD